MDTIGWAYHNAKLQPSQNFYSSEKLNKPRTNFIFQGNLWLFRFMKAIGCFPITVDQSGHFAVRWNTWTFYYTTVIILFCLTYSASVTYVTVSNLVRFKMPFDEALLYSSFITAAVMLLIPILFSLEAKKLAGHLNEWTQFQEVFKKNTGKSLKTNGTKRFVVVTTCIVVFVGLSAPTSANLMDVVFKKYEMNLNFIYFAFLGLPYSGVVFCTIFLLWLALSCSVGSSSREVLLLLKDPKRLSTSKIKEIQRMWLALRSLCMGLGRTLSYSTFLLCWVLFAIALTQVYMSTEAVMKGDAAPIIQPLVALAFGTILGEIGYKTSCMVGSDFECHLQQLLHQEMREDCRTELEDFLKSVVSMPTTISLAGFFAVDRSINGSMYSNLLTYFIIMLQFRYNT